MSRLVVQLLPTLCPGRCLSVVGSRKPLFSRQGDWDGASALHCAAMALTLLGKLREPAQVWRSARGQQARFWDHAWPHIPHGLTLPELASFLWELNTGVQPVLVEGGASVVLRVCLRDLAAGWPVILAWRHPVTRDAHATLVVGVEGMSGRGGKGGRGCKGGGGQKGFTPHALWLLDPAEPEPCLVACNARLVFTAAGDRLTYMTARSSHPVELDGLVSVRRASHVPAT